MRRQKGVSRQVITYSQAFKIAVVKELEERDIVFDAIRRKCGIKGSSTVQKWARKYGKGELGKIARVEKPEEINERD